MARRRLQRWSGFVLLALLVLAGAAYGALAHMRSEAIQEVSAAALANGGGDAVDALIRYVGDPATPVREKNRAVWALGELRDERALPLLERLHVSDKCDHEHAVCQREVKKAIRKITGEAPNPYL